MLSCMGRIINSVFHYQRWLRKPIISLVFITSIGAALRIYNLGFKSLWVDEALLFQFANGNIEHVLRCNALYNGAPPLFALLLHAIMSIGTSEWILRVVSCSAGIASVPMMYYLSKNFVSHPFALIAALLVAISPSQIIYSQQVREYSLTFLLAQLILYVFLLCLQRLTFRRSLLFGLIISFSLFTQYGLGLLILALNIVFLVRVLRRDNVMNALEIWSVGQAMALVTVYAVYHLSLKYQFRSGGFGTESISAGYWNGTFQHLLHMAILNTRDIFSFAFPMTYLLIVCVIIGVIWISSDKDPMKSIGLMMLLIPFVVTFVFALFRSYPYIGGRHTIFLSPMIYVFVVLGMTFLFNLRHVRYIVLIIIGMLIFQGVKEATEYLRSEGTENMRTIVDQLTSEMSKNDLIYVYYAAQPAFEYYFRGNNHLWIKGVESRQNPDNYLKQIDEVIARTNRIWIVVSHNYNNEWNIILQHVAKQRVVWTVQCKEGVGTACLYFVE
jgi:mannosyltransferase